MIDLTRRVLLTGAAAAGLSACGPGFRRGSVTRGTVLRGDGRAPDPVAIYPVTRAFLTSYAAWPKVNQLPNMGWLPAQGNGSGGGGARIVSAGDTVTITIFDPDPNSLLTTPTSGSNAFPDIRVEPDGTVFLPYAGDVRIAGLSTARARARLQEALESVAPSVQVQLTLVEGRANSVEAVAGVAQPGIYPIDGRGRPVTSIIAAAGGVPPNLRNPLVRLHRGGRSYLTSLSRLYADPRLDSVLQPGDQIFVTEDPRSFVALGASGQRDLIRFEEDRLSVLQALALASGVDERRADPEGVLILREYPASALAAGVRGPRETQVVFAIDLASADGIFAARNLDMAPGDVLYVASSRLNTFETIAGLVSRAFGLVITASSVAD